MKLVSIVFSFRNEEKNLKELVSRVDATFKKVENYKYELLFVNDDSNGVIHKGISTRQFERAFTISEDIKVKNAELQNGLLNIDLERIIPEEKKARLINIS